MNDHPKHGCPVVAVGVNRAPFPTVVDAARWAGVSENAVRQAVEHGTRSGGFHWRYFDMPEDCQPLKGRGRNRPIKYQKGSYTCIKAMMAATGLTRRQIEWLRKKRLAKFC